jgi:hypothetical protein
VTVTFERARRENVSLLLGFAGGTGSGKTYSAMRVARGLAGDQPFAVIDTEAGRALHYGDSFQPWDHADLHPPFRPDAYAEAIAAADRAGYPVILVDSASHEHAGDGGLLDWQEEEYARLGGTDSVKMLSWQRPKQGHRKFVTRLTQVRAHLILCFRAEPKVDMVRDERGKMQVVPKTTLTGLDGWVPIAEKSLPFELTASFLLMADRPGVPRPIKLPDALRPFVPLDRPVDEQVGRALAEWAAGGAAAPAPEDHPGAEARLLGLAAALDVSDATEQAIIAKRGKRGYGAWLEQQIARAEEAIAAKGSGSGAVPAATEDATPAAVAADVEAASGPAPDATAADDEQSSMFQIPEAAKTGAYAAD